MQYRPIAPAPSQFLRLPHLHRQSSLLSNLSSSLARSPVYHCPGRRLAPFLVISIRFHQHSFKILYAFNVTIVVRFKLFMPFFFIIVIPPSIQSHIQSAEFCLFFCAYLRNSTSSVSLFWNRLYTSCLCHFDTHPFFGGSGPPTRCMNEEIYSPCHSVAG